LLRNLGEERRSGSSGDSKAILLGALAVVSAQMVHSAFDFNLHLASNALLAAFCLGILCGHPGRRSSDAVPLRYRWLVAPCVSAIVAFLGVLLHGSWSAERQVFALEAFEGRPPGSFTGKELAEASEKASLVLGKQPGARLAALRTNLYRKQYALGTMGVFREPDESLLLERQLAQTAVLDRGDWYVHLARSQVISRLGEEEGAHREFLQAMVRLPLYALVYQDYALALEASGNLREALHYYRIGSRFQDAAPRWPRIKELEKLEEQTPE
jgi:hypothetical protein